MDRLQPHDVERLRRSVAMLQPGAPALKRETALQVLAELLRVQRARPADPWRPGSWACGIRARQLSLDPRCAVGFDRAGECYCWASHRAM